MTVNDVITRAIVEYYNNPGTSNDSLTPVMVAHWINKALNDYWAVFQDNNFGYYASRENVLSVTSASNIYQMPNGSQSTTTFSFSGTPTSGNYVAVVNGVTITIAFNATAGALQTTLNGLFSPSAITVTGGPAPSMFTINWGFAVTSLSQTSNNMVNASAVAVSVTPVTNNLNVAIVTALAIRQGSAPNYQYQALPTYIPSLKYGSPYSWNNGLMAVIANNQSQPLAWCYEAGYPDPVTQLNTASIRLNPWPTGPLTLVYDCVRYPNPVLFDNQTTPQPIMGQVLDLPLHLHDGVVLYVLREAYLRMKADTTEINQLIKMFDDKHFNVESRSLQIQGPETIQVLNTYDEG